MFTRSPLIVLMLTGIFLFTGIIPCDIASAQNPCDPLLDLLKKTGIHDERQVASEKYAHEQVKSLVKCSQASTYKEFKTECFKAGIAIFDILGFDAKNEGNKKAWSDWKTDFLKTDSSDFLKTESVRETVRTINPLIVKAISDCYAHPATIEGWIQPSSDDCTFTLHLKYNPINQAKCKFTAPVTFTTNPFNKTILLSKEHERMIQKGGIVPIQGLAVTFQRVDPTIAVTLTINTDMGKEIVIIIPGNPDIKTTRALIEAKLTDQFMRVGKIQLYEPIEFTVTTAKPNNVTPYVGGVIQFADGWNHESGSAADKCLSPVKVIMDVTGRVYLEGIFGTAKGVKKNRPAVGGVQPNGVIIFNLPKGMRPLRGQQFLILTNEDKPPAKIIVTEDGDVIWYERTLPLPGGGSAPAGGDVPPGSSGSLSGISFRAVP